jgi:hypothetical protein
MTCDLFCDYNRDNKLRHVTIDYLTFLLPFQHHEVSLTVVNVLIAVIVTKCNEYDEIKSKCLRMCSIESSEE